VGLELVEGALDPDRDAGTGDRALGAEDPQLRDLTFGLGQRAGAARDDPWTVYSTTLTVTLKRLPLPLREMTDR